MPTNMPTPLPHFPPNPTSPNAPHASSRLPMRLPATQDSPTPNSPLSPQLSPLKSPSRYGGVNNRVCSLHGTLHPYPASHLVHLLRTLDLPPLFSPLVRVFFAVAARMPHLRATKYDTGSQLCACRGAPNADVPDKPVCGCHMRVGSARGRGRGSRCHAVVRQVRLVSLRRVRRDHPLDPPLTRHRLCQRPPAPRRHVPPPHKPGGVSPVL